MQLLGGTIGVFAVVFLLVGFERFQPTPPQLTFSDTQSWDPAIYAFAQQPLVLVTEAFTLPPPPSNTSAETTVELEYLHELVAERSPDIVADIEREVLLNTMSFGGMSFTTIVDPLVRPQTYRLFTAVRADLLPQIIRQKEMHDRIRPSYLDPTLSTVVAVPGHPSYPSGHATESYVIALILSELDPAGAAVYQEDAVTIGENRERAGVHYPSDTLAGRQLAEAYVAALKETAWYQEQIVLARAEWE